MIFQRYSIHKQFLYMYFAQEETIVLKFKREEQQLLHIKHGELEQVLSKQEYYHYTCMHVGSQYYDRSKKAPY